jgi:hypothetical protein
MRGAHERSGEEVEMKALLVALPILLMTGCATHYLVGSHAREDFSRVRYRTIFVKAVDQTREIDPQAMASIKANVEFKIRDLAFAMTARPETSDAFMEIHVVRYQSSFKWDPGKSGTYTEGYYDKKRKRWIPAHYVEGRPPGYYESGAVAIRLTLLDANTHQLLWDSLAAGAGAPSEITDDVLADLIGCLQFNLEGKDCQDFIAS